MWAEPWSPMPSPAAPTSPPSASATSATPRAAGPAGRSSTRTGSASSGGRPSSSTPPPASAIYNEVGLGIPRKNTKSTMASAAGLYMLDADGEPEPEVYVAAAARNQAGIVLGQARSMVQRSPLLLDRLVPHRYVDRVPAQRRDHALPVSPTPRSSTASTPRPTSSTSSTPTSPPSSTPRSRPAPAPASSPSRSGSRTAGVAGEGILAELFESMFTGSGELEDRGSPAHLPRPGQRHAHLLVRRPARRGHRGPRGLVRREPRLLAPRRQVPGRPVRAPPGPRRAPRVAPLPPQPVRRLRGRLAPRRRVARHDRRPARSTPPCRSASASTRARTASSARSRSRSARGTGSW